MKGWDSQEFGDLESSESDGSMENKGVDHQKCGVFKASKVSWIHAFRLINGTYFNQWICA